MIAGRAIISALVLWLAFSGVAAGEQFYVNESGWWCDGGAFNASTAPISAAVGAAGEGDSIFMHNGSNDVVLVLDISGSMRDSEIVSGTGVSFLSYEKELANKILDDKEFRDDYVGVVTFGTHAQMLSPLVYFGNNQTRVSLENAVQAFEPTGQQSTSLEDGLSMAEEMLANSSGAKEVIILSDGQKIDYERSLAIATQMKNKDIRMHFIQVTSSPTSALTSYEKIAHAANASYTQTTYPRLIVVRTSEVLVPDNDISIFVYNGSYYENVDVNKRLTLEGEGADVVTVTAATSSTAFKVTADYVNISGFAVRRGTDSYVAGIYLNNVDYCNISENNVCGNNYGIHLSSSSNNTLTNNTANSNNWGGIYLSYSSNNTLTNNTASDNDYGIYLSYSSNNTLMSNTANSNNDDGIQLSFSSNNTLTGNTANSNNYDGIILYNSSNNNITCNWVQDNARYGFHLSSGSTDNIISYNNIITNGNYNTTSGGWEWQFYMGQCQPVEVKHNYWGAGMNDSTIDASIYDDDESPYRGGVEFYPFETDPITCTPAPDESSTFTTADAVIALQIAAGSRPSDPRWDVSRDGSVTSLDALMILQAAAGSIEIG